MADNDDLCLKRRTIRQLLQMQAVLRHLGYPTIADEVTRELAARRYEPCTCRMRAGDNPACPVHRAQP